MNESSSKRRSAMKPRATSIDREGGRARRDADIAAAATDDPDTAPALDEAWFRSARIVLPERKIPVSLRLDKDVIAWFKARGAGYQSRINAVLKAYVRARGSQR